MDLRIGWVLKINIVYDPAFIAIPPVAIAKDPLR